MDTKHPDYDNVLRDAVMQIQKIKQQVYEKHFIGEKNKIVLDFDLHLTSALIVRHLLHLEENLISSPEINIYVLWEQFKKMLDETIAGIKMDEEKEKLQ